MFMRPSFRFSMALLVIALASPMLGCGDDTADEHDAATSECGSGDHDGASDEGGDGGEEEPGMPSGSACPKGSTLTWDNFGQEFMSSYCTRCHSSELECGERHDAPLEHDFDTAAGVLLVGEHVDRYAAAGPNGVNELMPKDGDKPSEEERRKLGEWLACGAK